MLFEGINLMVVGMTTVFSFLTLLVIVLQVSARFFERFGDRWPDATLTSEPAGSTPGTQSEEIAVVLAAITAYRGRKR